MSNSKTVLKFMAAVNLGNISLGDNTLFPVHNFQCLYVQANISDVALRYVLNVGMKEGIILSVEKNKSFTLLSNCWDLDICKSGFRVCSSK